MNTQKTLAVANWVAVGLLTVALILLSYLYVIRMTFKDVSSVMALMKQAQTYTYLADIIKLEIRDHYPKQFSNHIVYSIIADKLVDAVITPGLIEQLTGPALKASVFIAKQPTAIIDDNVVLNTAGYKQQALSSLPGFGLPSFLNGAAKAFIDAVPNTITLVDLEKRPNSVLAGMIKLRTLLEQSKVYYTYTIILTVLLSAGLFALNLHKWKRLLLSFAIGTGIAAGLLFVLSKLVPMIMSNVMTEPGAAQITVLENNMILSAVTVLLNQTNRLGIVYAAIAVACVGAWLVMHYDKAIDKFWLAHAPKLKKPKKTK